MAVLLIAEHNNKELRPFTLMQLQQHLKLIQMFML